MDHVDNRDDIEIPTALGGGGGGGSNKQTHDYATMSPRQLEEMAARGDKTAALMIAFWKNQARKNHQGTSEGSDEVLGSSESARNQETSEGSDEVLSSSVAGRKRKYASPEEMYGQELDHRPYNDMSASSAHLNTGHAEPDEVHYGHLSMLLQLPAEAHRKICEQCKVFPLREKSLLNETDFHMCRNALVLAVLEHSSLGELVRYTNTTQFFDVITDFTLLLRKNLFPIGGGEVKKGKCKLDPDYQKKNGQVYGQVANQMASMTLNGPKSPPMLLTTLNQWQLSSNRPMNEIEEDIKEIESKLGEIQKDPTVLLRDWSSEQGQEKGSPEAAITAPKSQTQTQLYPPQEVSSANQRNLKHSGIASSTQLAVSDAVSVPDPPHTPKERKAKKGSKIMSLLDLESRKVYNSQPFDFPADATNAINLIYTWFLLALRGSTNRYKFDPFAKPVTAPCRALNIGRGENSGTQYFCNKFGHLEEGIDFQSTPSGNQKSFLLWSPLGFTDSSMCCFATNNLDGFTISRKKKEEDGDGQQDHDDVGGEKKDEDGNGQQNGQQNRDTVGVKKPRAASPWAIKFFKGNTNETEAQAKIELEVWRKLYPGFSFMTVNTLFEETTYLVMPYLQAFSCLERREMLDDKSGRSKLVAAFRWLYGKGYKYKDQDIRWRHVGWYWINNQRQIGFCDFGSMDETPFLSAPNVDEDAEAQTWSEHAVQKLADNFNENAYTAAYVQDSLIPDGSTGIANLAVPE